MYLYKLEVELKDQKVYVTLLAENDAQAFDYLEEQLVRHFIRNPEVVEASIIEKKRAVKGSGYVIETILPQ
ncbi:DUF3906 family protein [Paenibacillus doosanensis]|uniref:DUF3906 domain-containing protein n=1 Tax=Paenibacillus konkukensis TaxID=2020716 RepID=A0ABY4RND0_9BACL|nr:MULTISPECIES: DUF3906 family protein [Paenibacillus]MCS7460164.1 DUF3906 family protein [Paenibacillus doosanensis]UQZ82822.1 hypothetical protein SK3146_01982 [Paenibacillus konkukensis]